MEHDTFRNISLKEKKLLHCLLSSNCLEYHVLEKQIESVQVREMDDNGSIEFRTDSNLTMSDSVPRIPVEGQFEDIDGVTIHALLHVVKGKIRELEIFKEDSSRIIKLPPTQNMAIFIQH